MNDSAAEAEATTRPRLKGFLLSGRARDPVLAREESAAAAAITIARKRAADVRQATVSVVATFGPTANDDTDVGDSSVAATNGVHPVAFSGQQEREETVASQSGANKNQESSAAARAAAPSATLQNAVAAYASSSSGLTVTNTVVARRGGGEGGEGREGRISEYSSGTPACAVDLEERSCPNSAAPGSPSTPTLTAPGGGDTGTDSRGSEKDGDGNDGLPPRGATQSRAGMEMPQAGLPDRRSRAPWVQRREDHVTVFEKFRESPSLPSPSSPPRPQEKGDNVVQQKQQGLAPVTATADSDALLSHRLRVRAVNFSRPHTHQARKRKGRGVDKKKGATPGPGEYNVGGLGFRCREEAGAGGGATIAPRRYLHTIADFRIRGVFLYS